MEKTGKILGVPYDFRRPTLARIRERMWNLDEPRVLVPRVFGIGYTINLATLREKSTLGFYAVLVLYTIMAVNIVRSAKRRLSGKK